MVFLHQRQREKKSCPSSYFMPFIIFSPPIFFYQKKIKEMFDHHRECLSIHDFVPPKAERESFRRLIKAFWSSWSKMWWCQISVTPLIDLPRDQENKIESFNLGIRARIIWTKWKKWAKLDKWQTRKIRSKVIRKSSKEDNDIQNKKINT